MLHLISFGVNRFGTSVMIRSRQFPSWWVDPLTIWVSPWELPIFSAILPSSPVGDLLPSHSWWWQLKSPARMQMLTFVLESRWSSFCHSTQVLLLLSFEGSTPWKVPQFHFWTVWKTPLVLSWPNLYYQNLQISLSLLQVLQIPNSQLWNILQFL